MKSIHVLHVISLIACIFAIGIIAGGFVVDEITPFLRTTSLLAGLLLMAAAWFLVIKSKFALLLLWLSPAIYCFSMVYPGFLKYGADVFGILKTEFYLSLSFRIALAVFAQLAFRFISLPSEKN